MIKLLMIRCNIRFSFKFPRRRLITIIILLLWLLYRYLLYLNPFLHRPRGQIAGRPNWWRWFLLLQQRIVRQNITSSPRWHFLPGRRRSFRYHRVTRWRLMMVFLTIDDRRLTCRTTGSGGSLRYRYGFSWCVWTLNRSITSIIIGSLASAITIALIVNSSEY